MPVLRSKRVKKDRAKKTLEFIDAKNEDKRTKRKLTETDARKKNRQFDRNVCECGLSCFANLSKIIPFSFSLSSHL